MFKFIEGLPQGVMAIEATGKVTHEDYHNKLLSLAAEEVARSIIAEKQNH